MVKSYTRRILKRIFLKLGLRKQRVQLRKDVEIIPIQPNLKLIVYWKVLKIGKGPALIMQAEDKKILKFDCFGKEKGHYHEAPNYVDRIFFDEQTALEQINRTVLELKENAQSHLKKQPELNINQIIIDQKKLIIGVDYAKIRMIYFLETIPELADIQ